MAKQTANLANLTNTQLEVLQDLFSEHEVHAAGVLVRQYHEMSSWSGERKAWNYGRNSKYAWGKVRFSTVDVLVAKGFVKVTQEVTRGAGYKAADGSVRYYKGIVWQTASLTDKAVELLTAAAAA